MRMVLFVLLHQPFLLNRTFAYHIVSQLPPPLHPPPVITGVSNHHLPTVINKTQEILLKPLSK